jgi:F-type H+-transporting ATPase subunit gamma
MSRIQDVANQREAMDTIVNLTSVFEGIASMRIAQTKNQVLQSQQFFSELWNIYTQLRVDKLFRFGRTTETEKVNDKQLFIIITSEGGFSGDIDQKLIDTMLKQYDAKKQDIIVIGHHGAVQLIQQGISFKKYFTLPSKDQNINVQPLIREVRSYRDTVVFYETYVSLMVQDVRSIDLSNAVKEEVAGVGGAPGKKKEEEYISERNYIFEPSAFEVVAHLERSMMQIALSQVILESKLAQYASRFRAMSMAKDRAHQLHDNLNLLYNRTKRRTQDERLKEMINGLRKTRTV